MFKRSVVLILGVVIVISLIAAGFITGRNKPASQGKIAVIHVEGVIIGGQGEGFLKNGGGTDEIIKQLRQVREDPTIKAVVIRINSPGGSAPASQEVGEEITKLRAAGKTVVTSMGDVAASGGYWIAAGTEKIYANPATLTGSIGVYIPYTNWEELYKKIGVQQEKIKSGPHKDILSPERQMTSAERAIIQDMVDDIYNQFIDVIATGRNMDPARVRQLADGRIYTGSQAKALGLVDEMGNLQDAIEGAAQLAGIQGKPEIKEFGPKSPFSKLLGAEEQLEIGKLLFNQIKGESPLFTPLAMPEKW